MSSKIDITKPWPMGEHVASIGCYGMMGNRVGTRWLYETGWRDHVNARGFRLRPTYKRYKAARGEHITIVEAAGLKVAL